MNNIQFINEGTGTKTLFLAHQNSGNELFIETTQEFSADDRRGILEFIITYLLKENKLIKDQETFAYGVSMLKFTQENEGLLRINDYNPEQDTINPVVSKALAIFKEQLEICNRMKTNCQPPMPHQLVVISDGVYEGLPVEGVRYPSPEHMSGWWLYTEKYNGDIKTLQNVHVSHLIEKRPDLVKYLGLPSRFRFVENTSQIWLDESIEE